MAKGDVDPNICYLIFDNSPDDDSPVVEYRARYASLNEAKAQAIHDIAHGKRIIRIEDDNQKKLWEPK